MGELLISAVPTGTISEFPGIMLSGFVGYFSYKSREAKSAKSRKWNVGCICAILELYWLDELYKAYWALQTYKMKPHWGNKSCRSWVFTSWSIGLTDWQAVDGLTSARRRTGQPTDFVSGFASRPAVGGAKPRGLRNFQTHMHFQCLHTSLKLLIMRVLLVGLLVFQNYGRSIASIYAIWMITGGTSSKPAFSWKFRALHSSPLLAICF